MYLFGVHLRRSDASDLLFPFSQRSSGIRDALSSTKIQLHYEKSCYFTRRYKTMILKKRVISILCDILQNDVKRENQNSNPRRGTKKERQLLSCLFFWIPLEIKILGANKHLRAASLAALRQFTFCRGRKRI